MASDEIGFGITPTCKGGRCDDEPRCIAAGFCTYRSSAEEAKELWSKTHDVEKLRRFDESIDVTRRAANGIETIAITQKVRQFTTGATRSLDTDKPDYEAFLSPLVLERYAEYMHKNRFQADGSIRDGDNWQKGIPLKSYMKSGWRHFLTWWKGHRGYEPFSEEDLCALLFNVHGYLHETLKAKRPTLPTAHVSP